MPFFGPYCFNFKFFFCFCNQIKFAFRLLVSYYNFLFKHRWHFKIYQKLSCFLFYCPTDIIKKGQFGKFKQLKNICLLVKNIQLILNLAL